LKKNDIVLKGMLMDEWTKLGKSFVPILQKIYDWGVANKIAERSPMA
jgi:DNA-binding HxlR family transcriptional regulator